MRRTKNGGRLCVLPLGEIVHRTYKYVCGEVSIATGMRGGWSNFPRSRAENDPAAITKRTTSSLRRGQRVPAALFSFSTYNNQAVHFPAVSRSRENLLPVLGFHRWSKFLRDLLQTLSRQQHNFELHYRLHYKSKFSFFFFTFLHFSRFFSLSNLFSLNC